VLKCKNVNVSWRNKLLFYYYFKIQSKSLKIQIGLQIDTMTPLVFLTKIIQFETVSCWDLVWLELDSQKSGWGQGFKVNGPLWVFQSHQGQQPGVQERSLSLWRSPLLCSAEGHASNRPTQSPDLWERVSESKKWSTGSLERWAD